MSKNRTEIDMGSGGVLAPSSGVSCSSILQTCKEMSRVRGSHMSCYGSVLGMIQVCKQLLNATICH